jgi:hypothetical protein
MSTRSRAPVSVRPAHLEHPDFDVGGHLVGTPLRPMGAVGRAFQPLGLVVCQSAVN